MVDRPVWFQMKTAPWKSQTTVSRVTGSVAYWLHVTSFQAVVATQSVSCWQWKQVHCRLLHMPRPSNPQTNQYASSEGSRARCSMFSHSPRAHVKVLLWSLTSQQELHSASSDLSVLWGSMQRSLQTSIIPTQYLQLHYVLKGLGWQYSVLRVVSKLTRRCVTVLKMSPDFP